jgi:hypothetical protein
MPRITGFYLALIISTNTKRYLESTKVMRSIEVSAIMACIVIVVLITFIFYFYFIFNKIANPWFLMTMAAKRNAMISQ